MIVKKENGLASITDGKRVLVVDRSGRLLIYSNGRDTYRRSLFNEFIKVGYKDGIRVAKVLSEEEAKGVAAEAYSFLFSARDELNGYLDNLDGLGWDFLVKDSARLFKIYRGPVPIVPPDQYFPIYVQLTVGCAWNRCTFCHLYRDKSYRVLNEEELVKMIDELKEYFGPSLPSRRSVFLGDANALLLEYGILSNYLKIIKRSFDLPIYSFIDAFLTPNKLKEEEIKGLKSLGVERVYFGVESGSEEVLKLLNKPLDPEEAVEFINSFKRAGIHVGVIFLAGAGGKRYWEQHIIKSAELASRLRLDRKDIIYVSPLHEYKDLPYWEIAKEVGLLSYRDKINQFNEMKKAIEEAYLRRNSKELEAPVVLYDIIEAVY